MTRSWVVRECFLVEVAFKVDKPGRKEEAVLEEKSAHTESLRQESHAIPELKMGKTGVCLGTGK